MRDGATPACPPGFISESWQAQARPYADVIWRRLRLLEMASGRSSRRTASEDPPDPGGAELFGEGTPDAEAWDRYGRRGRPVSARVWLLAALQSREEDRMP